LTVNLELLNSLFQAKLAELRDLAIGNDIPKTGNVEQLRAKLIGKLILDHVDLTDSGIKSMQNRTNINLIVAGGLSSIDDLVTLSDMNVSAVIIGKAAYTGDIDIQKAVIKFREN